MRKPVVFRCLQAALIAMLFCALGIGAAPASAYDCAAADVLPSGSTTEAYGDATLCLVNEERVAGGRRPLRRSRQLAAAARAYATEIVATGHFAHRSPSGESIIDRVARQRGGLRRWILLGENLGWGSSTLATPRELVQGWMGSPTHRANVLNPLFTHLGVGVTFAAPGDPARPEAATYATAFGAIDRVLLRRRASRSRR